MAANWSGLAANWSGMATIGQVWQQLVGHGNSIRPRNQMLEKSLGKFR